MGRGMERGHRLMKKLSGPGCVAFWIALALPATAYAQNGLTGEYFPETDFTGAMLTRTDATVDFANAEFVAADFSDSSTENFSIRWVGSVQAPGTGTVAIPITFFLRADDGSRLWVDGVPVVDQWRDQGIPNQPGPSGVINLIPGQRYAIVV